MLGIRYPILLGGMAHVSRAPLVAAVSEAGGLGVIGSGGMPPDLLVTQIAEVREKTNCPFGVNLMLMDPNIDEQMEHMMSQGLPESGRAYMGMLGFKIVINHHGEVIRVEQPAASMEDE